MSYTHNIDPGRLVHRVQIQQRAQAPGALGHPVDAWQPVMPTAPTLAAEVLPVSGRERLASAAVQGSHTHTVLVRWYAALAQPASVVARWRVVHGAVAYNVRAAVPLKGGRQWLVLDCEEGGTSGH